MSQADYDVVVVGGGGAGLSAASMAAEAGARVLIVESGDRVGGSTGMSQGAFFAGGTKVQEAAGVKDTVDDVYRYGMALNQMRMNPAVFRRFCEEAPQALHWLITLGVEFGQLTCGDEAGVPRSHWATGFGAEIVSRLEARLQAQGVDVSTRSRVRRIVTEAGAVRGVEVDGTVVTARSVVIASGGMGGDKALLETYYPTVMLNGEHLFYIGAKTNMGDHVGFAKDVGADLDGFDTGLRLATSNLAPILELPPAWLVFVNKRGRRFIRESASYNVMGGVFDAQPEGVVHGIFDHAAFTAPPRDPRVADAIAAGLLSTAWTPDVLEQALASGHIVRADSLEALGATLGVDPAALSTTIARYNANVAGGADPDFFKEADQLHQVVAPPFYAVPLRPALLVFTSMGLRIDADGRALDAAGRPIPGLYAAGESSGGVMGELYMGSGNSIGAVITYGRIAGGSAGRYATSNFPPQ